LWKAEWFSLMVCECQHDPTTSQEEYKISS
jgi:hypothetical protein